MSQRGREIIYNCKFSEVHILEKGQEGACIQKEVCLNFSQAKRNFKATWAIYPD
jgi:hypothetical protein